MDVTEARGRAWFEGLVRETSDQMRRYAARRVPPDRVDDVVAETYATAWSRLACVPDPPNALPWLYRTAANHVNHDRRGSARRARLADRLAALPQPVVADPADLVSDDTVAALFSRIPPGEAEVLRLSVWEGLSPAEIATVLGCRPSAARMRLLRARHRAADLLSVTPSPRTTPGAAPGKAPAPSLPTPVVLRPCAEE